MSFFAPSSVAPLVIIIATVTSLASIAAVRADPIPFGSNYPLQLLEEYPIDTLVAQMSQLDMNSFLISDTVVATYNESEIRRYIVENKVGSLFNSPSSMGSIPVCDVHWWRAFQTKIYNWSVTSNVTAGGSGIPVLFGIDSVHGANYVFNSTIFPQQIGMAATFNTTVADDAGFVTGLETRAAGIPWVFSPILGLAVQPSWARVYETFGEDTMLASQMGQAIISALQREAPASMNLPNGTPAVAACMKHYIGYPNVRTGHDRTPVWMPMDVLLQYFAPPFETAIDYAGVLSAMENYIELNGRPVVASELLLSHLLRDAQGFIGMLVTDYDEVYHLYEFHKTAGSYSDAVLQSINQTTVDMAMISSPYDKPLFADLLAAHVAAGNISSYRVATSAARVLNLKKSVGLLDRSPVPDVVTRWNSNVSTPSSDVNASVPAPGTTQPWLYSNSPYCVFGCDSHRAKALDAARQSMTLLQNNGSFLPINASRYRHATVAVIGLACNSTPLLAGGWTVAWQGTDNASAFPYGTTVYGQLAAMLLADGAEGVTVTYSEGCNVTEDSTCDPQLLNEAVAAAKAASLVVMCLGERHYAEKPGDINDLTLPGQQIEMAQRVAAVQPNIVVVLVEGRPRLLGPVPQLAMAVLHAYLPGPFGGQAIAEVLMGRVNPSGRLPITYPRTANNAPIQYWRKYSADTNGDYDVQWSFGTGLSYSTIVFSDMRALFIATLKGFFISVTVKNEGPYDATVSIPVYFTQVPRPIAPEVQQMKAFTKVFVAAGETKMVPFDAPIFLRDLAYVDEWWMRQVFPGPATFSIVGETSTVSVSVAVPSLDPLLLDPVIWYKWFQDHYKGTIAPSRGSPTPAPKELEDYFVSSIVCFVAGIVLTIIIVSLLSKRRADAQRKMDGEANAGSFGSDGSTSATPLRRAAQSINVGIDPHHAT